MAILLLYQFDCTRLLIGAVAAGASWILLPSFFKKNCLKGFLEVVHKNLGVVSTIFSPVKGSENRPQEGGHHTLKDSLKLRVEGAAKIVFQNFWSKWKLVISISHFWYIWYNKWSNSQECFDKIPGISEFLKNV